MRPDIDSMITEVVRERAGIEVGAEVSFFAAGLTSSAIADVHAGLQQRLGRQFPIAAFFRYPNRAALRGFLAEDAGTGTDPAMPFTRDGWTPPVRRELRARLWQRKG